MDKMVIVIIDSGVYKNHSLFKNDIIEEYIYSDENNSFENIDGQDNDIFGHGTAIYNIIRECKNFARIINIRINNIENGISEETLIAVLKGVAKKFKPNIINLSLGLNICNNYNELYEQCETITNNGGIIISAFDNTGAISYPAAFDNVIGVITGRFCSKRNEFEYIDDTVVNIAAKGGIQRVAWTHPDYIMIGGNSFACAHVTVQAAKYILTGKTGTKSVLSEFKINSVKKYKIESSYKPVSFEFTINRAIIFPFNKEMHSLIRYQNLLSFDVVDVYDSKYSTNIGATTDHLLKCKNKKDFLIKNIKDIYWDNFDTLILGHLDELSNLTGRTNLKKDLIQQAIAKGKNIYAFDENPDCNGSNIFYPIINKQSLPPDRFGMLYRISKPVVGILGTSSRQGKFTLQLKLRELLLERGYSIGQIGTDPSALLYGMDSVFPMGYNSSVYIQGFDVIRYTNYIINILCQKNIDLILIGSQSGTVPFDTGNIIQYNIPQYDFLAGTLPDIVILCINPFDDINHIARTIKFIESSVDCKVLSLVVFPMTIRDDWSAVFGGKKILNDNEFNNIKEELSQFFNVSIYNLGNVNHINELLDEIINYLS